MTPEPTFFFYDLETSGRDFRRHRIMQFAGRRTTLNLEPIGEPVDLVIKLADDILPEPEATLITGITPQSTQNGLTEAELVKYLHTTILTPGTIMTGFNSVRFDDEYLRFTFYRCFYDAYAWAWKDGRSRWDLLDVVRMTRALRPQGITWPVDEAGDPSNKLTSLTTANKVEHLKAHDAMSDVDALIAVARLVKEAQPKLWQYLLNLRAKAAVASVIKPEQPEPFVYTSGMYGKEHDFTSVAVVIGEERGGCYYVYDLRHDPTPFLTLTPDELRERIFSKRSELEAANLIRLPVKQLTVNKCPAVAPLATLTPDAADRLHLSLDTIKQHLAVLQQSDLPARIAQAYRSDRTFEPGDPDGALYGGFVADDAATTQVRAATALTIGSLQPNFSDSRLPELFLRYKGRNFPDQLSDDDRSKWEAYRAQRVMADIEPWSNTLQDRYATATSAEQVLLTDLQLWAESIYPTEF